MLRVSATMMYKKGERGQPCLNPLELLKYLLGLPLIRGAVQGVEMHPLMMLMKLFEIPNFFRAAVKKEWSTLSKAFAMSSLTIMPRSPLLRLLCIAS